MIERRKLREEERLALLRKWDNMPSPNPRHKDMTPSQAARASVHGSRPAAKSADEL